MCVCVCVKERKEKENGPAILYLLSEGRSESKAKAESFFLSGCVMLSNRSTHISITFPKSWSIWRKKTSQYLKCYLHMSKCC